MKRPEHVIADAAVGLGRALRDAGLATTVDEELFLCRALGELDLRSREQVYWAARASFTRRPEDARIIAITWIIGQSPRGCRRHRETSRLGPRY